MGLYGTVWDSMGHQGFYAALAAYIGVLKHLVLCGVWHEDTVKLELLHTSGCLHGHCVLIRGIHNGVVTLKGKSNADVTS